MLQVHILTYEAFNASGVYPCYVDGLAVTGQTGCHECSFDKKHQKDPGLFLPRAAIIPFLLLLKAQEILKNKPPSHHHFSPGWERQLIIGLEEEKRGRQTLSVSLMVCCAARQWFVFVKLPPPFDLTQHRARDIQSGSWTKLMMLAIKNQFVSGAEMTCFSRGNNTGGF